MSLQPLDLGRCAAPSLSLLVSLAGWQGKAQRGQRKGRPQAATARNRLRPGGPTGADRAKPLTYVGSGEGKQGRDSAPPDEEAAAKG
ncbi:hypothetical protein GCM10010324_53340 [Streptomyces hiroshimensis]|uniref:Uncharacterized protein n=1 Tax=Streptomyces hiroshimensis TaxID=66424 RepID=A0ABQ2YZQ3_9ACTN|nr:hypothetical protein GCM10010324_53340 [Streptomyces hiroshimensis]